MIPPVNGSALADRSDSASYSSGNRVLDSLAGAGLTDLAGDVRVHEITAHQATHSIGRDLRFVDFPIDAVLSVVAHLAHGETVEVGTVGNESFVESEAALGSSVSSRTSFCQVDGRIARMPIDRFEARMATEPLFADAMRRSVRAMLFSAQQYAACNMKHTDVQRCARWFAMTADRVGRDRFVLTDTFLSIMLGVRAPEVSRAVRELHKRGAVEDVLGNVTILDENVLKRNACECYEASKAAFAHSLLR